MAASRSGLAGRSGCCQLCAIVKRATKLTVACELLYDLSGLAGAKMGIAVYGGSEQGRKPAVDLIGSGALLEYRDWYPTQLSLAAR